MAYIRNSVERTSENVLSAIRRYLEGEIGLDEFDDEIDELAKEAEYESVVKDDMDLYYSQLTA